MFFQPLSIFARLEVIRKVNVLIFAGRLMTTTASRFTYAENSGSVGKLYGPFFLALKLLEPSPDYSQTLARMRKRGERGSNCWRGVGFSPF
jgi:hypothetical protein